MIDTESSAGVAMNPQVQGQRVQLVSPQQNSAKGPINEFFEWFGDLGIFFWRVVRAAVTPPFEFRELFRQLDEIGSKSLPLVALAGAATGVVLSLEARYSLTRFGAKSLLPAAIVFSVIHETGPIITGLVVSGRVGAGIGAELASMKVTEQIDAIEASAVNPYRLLIIAVLAWLYVRKGRSTTAELRQKFGRWEKAVGDERRDSFNINRRGNSPLLRLRLVGATEPSRPMRNLH